MTEPLLVERTEGIVTLTLHNPDKMNAFSQAMRDRLAERLAELQAEIDLQPMVWLSADHREGKQAFAERRKPKFKGV